MDEQQISRGRIVNFVLANGKIRSAIVSQNFGNRVNLLVILDAMNDLEASYDGQAKRELVPPNAWDLRFGFLAVDGAKFDGTWAPGTWHWPPRPVSAPRPLPPLEVGDIVHYVSHGSADGTHKSGHRAAIVTEVGEKDVVSLTVLNCTGMFFNRNVEHDPTGRRVGTWHRRESTR